MDVMHTKSADNMMDNIDYLHNIPLSLEARVIRFTMSLIGLKKKMKKKMVFSSFETEPAQPPKSLQRKFTVQKTEQDGRKVWRISKRE